GHRLLGRRGQLLLRRPPPARRQPRAPAPPFDGRPDPDVRRRGARLGSPRPAPRLHRAHAVVPRLPAGSGATGLAHPRTGPEGAPAARSPPPLSFEAGARPHARRNRVPLPSRRARSLAPPPRPPLPAHRRRQVVLRLVPAGRIRLRAVRRELQLARSGLVPGQLSDRRVAAPLPDLLWR